MGALIARNLTGAGFFVPVCVDLPYVRLVSTLHRVAGSILGTSVPVTAKLSRKFYETLGDEVANELVGWFNEVDATYRLELRELNDLNFARFDARVGERFAESDLRWEKRFAELEARWEKRFAQLEARWEKRFAELEARWEHRFAELEARVARLEAHFDVKLAALRADLLKWMFLFWATNALAVLGLALR
jgi:hypothetical protein